MNAQAIQPAVQPGWTWWLKVGLIVAVVAVVAVLVVQVAATALWPEIALFAPLDSLARSALFTLIPALGATAVFAWLARRGGHPIKTFLILSAVLLFVSIVPDYILPVPNKTLLASTVAAFLHVVAAAVIVGGLLISYRRLENV
jgi:hypothetical protein